MAGHREVGGRRKKAKGKRKKVNGKGKEEGGAPGFFVTVHSRRL